MKACRHVIVAGLGYLAAVACAPEGRTPSSSATVAPATRALAANAVSLADAWAPSLLQPGGRFRVTFDRPGRFEYTCSIHSSMTGWVIVE
jgi:hypothetical protein